MHLPNPIRLIAKVSGVALLALSAVIGVSGAAFASPMNHGPQCGSHGDVLTIDESSTYIISAPRHLCAGLERVTINSAVPDTGNNSPNVQLFQLEAGATLAQFRAELPIVISAPGNVPDPAAAAAETWIEHHVIGYGGAQSSGTTHYLVRLDRGDYFIADLAAFVKMGTVRKIDVDGFTRGDQRLPYTGQKITAIDTSAGSRFVISNHALHDGWVTVQNKSDELHFVLLIRVKPGTTNADVTRFLAGKGPDPTEPQFGYQAIDVISPGVSINWYLKVPSGRYVVICFMTDDMTGEAHAFMGMHTVVNVFHY